MGLLLLTEVIVWAGDMGVHEGGGWDCFVLAMLLHDDPWVCVCVCIYTIEFYTLLEGTITDLALPPKTFALPLVL